VGTASSCRSGRGRGVLQKDRSNDEGDPKKDNCGQDGNRRKRPGRTGGDGHGKTRSDTMLGIDKLYSIGAKGHIYIVHVQVCKYAGKPPNKWGNIIYSYIHLTERSIFLLSLVRS
jgi:hypothetical protein